jgi:hypothetical protein
VEDSALCLLLALGSGVTCWRRLAAWNEAGVWDQLHGLLLKEPTRLVEGGDRLVPRPGRTPGPKSGPSPVDRARPGGKHHPTAALARQDPGRGRDRRATPSTARNALRGPRLRARQVPPTSARARHPPGDRRTRACHTAPARAPSAGPSNAPFLGCTASRRPRIRQLEVQAQHPLPSRNHLRPAMPVAAKSRREQSPSLANTLDR